MTARTTDINGFTLVRRNPISKVGVFDYTAASVGLRDGDPNRIVKVYRPAEELGNPDTIESFKLQPWVDDHTMLGDGPGLTPAERKGVGGVIGEQVEFDATDGTLYANLKVFSKAHAAVIASGKKDLSCGYRCKYDPTPGTFDGVKYDMVQREIRGNHLATVKEGRMGPDVAVLDHLTFALDGVLETEPVLTIEQVKEWLAAATPEQKAELAASLAPPADDTPKPPLTPPAKTADELAAEAAAKTAADAEAEAAAKAAADAEAAPPATMDAALARIAKLEADAKAAAAAPPAMDAAAIVASIADRDQLATRLARVVGTFDHSAMDAAAVVAYGIDKLKLKVAAGAERATLDGYLLGHQPARPVTAAQDAAPNPASPVTAYIAGPAS